MNDTHDLLTAAEDLGETTEIDVVERLVPLAGLRVVGCGGGRVTKQLVARGAEAVGVEPDPIQAEKNRAAEPVPGLSFVEASGQALPFDDDSFDAVVAMYVASVVPDPKRLLREMRRVCIPGGNIVIVNHFTSRGGVMRAVEKGLSRLSKQLGWRSEFDLEPLLRAAGLEVVEIRRTRPIGLFTLIDCRNNPDPALVSRAAAAITRRSILGDQPSAVG